MARVITVLSSGSAEHVPYRDSKLTRLLRDSLGGNAKTALVVTINPLRDFFSETKRALQFGSRAMQVRLNPVKNTPIVDYAKLARRLQNQLDDATALLTSKELDIVRKDTLVNQLESENAQLLTQLSEYQQKYSDTSVELERNNSEIKRQHSQLEENTNKLTKRTETFRKQITVLQGHLASAREEANSSFFELQKVRDEHLATLNQLNELQMNYSSQDSKNSDRVAELLATVETLEKENGSLKLQNQELHSTLTNVESLYMSKIEKLCLRVEQLESRNQKGTKFERSRGLPRR